MAILFSCECGQQLAVRDENAGRQVRCTGCNAVLVAPNGTAPQEAPAAPADSSMIRFSCPECHQVVQARAEFAGKRTRCPGCDLVVSIPRASGEPSAVAARVEKPLPWRTGKDEPEGRGDGSSLREEDFADEERLRRRLKKNTSQGGGSKLWIIAACLLLLVGAGVAGWMLFFRGNLFGSSTKTLNFVPRNALAFGSIHFGQMLRNDGGKRNLDNLTPEQRQQLRLVQDQTGLDVMDVEDIALVALDPKGESYWMVVQMNKVVIQGNVLKNTRKVQQEHQGKKFYADEASAIYFVDRYTLAIGSVAGIKHCLELPEEPVSGPLDEAVKLAASGKYQMVLAGSGEGVKAVADQARMNLGWANKSAFEEAKFILMTFGSAPNFTMELTVDFPAENKAAAAKIELDNLVSQAKGFLLLGGLWLNALKAQAPEADVELSLEMMSKLLDSTQTRLDGAKVSATLSVTRADMEKMMKKHEARANQVQPFPRRR